MRRQKRKETIKNVVVEYINENSKTYLAVTIIFFIGIVLGIIFVNNTNQNKQGEISSYINNFISSIKNSSQISNTELFKEYSKNDLYTTTLLWFLGSTVIGAPLIYLVIAYKGYSIGYTISSIIATVGTGKGILFIIITMLLKYIIYIPCLLSLAVSGIKLYKLIIEDRRRENIKVQIIKHTLFCLMMFGLMIISSLIGTYVSTSLLIVLTKWC